MMFAVLIALFLCSLKSQIVLSTTTTTIILHCMTKNPIEVINFDDVFYLKVS